MRPQGLFVQFAFARYALLLGLYVLTRQPVLHAPQAEVETPGRLGLAAAVLHKTTTLLRKSTL